MTGTISRADVATKDGRKYLVQLCKHFQHKRPASWGDDRGRIEFGSGLCELSADDSGLHVVATANDADSLPQLQDVIARHLVRFAFREELAIDWKGDAQA